MAKIVNKSQKMLNKKRVAIALFEMFLMTFMIVAVSVMMSESVVAESREQAQSQGNNNVITPAVGYQQAVSAVGTSLSVFSFARPTPPPAATVPVGTSGGGAQQLTAARQAAINERQNLIRIARSGDTTGGGGSSGVESSVEQQTWIERGGDKTGVYEVNPQTRELEYMGDGSSVTDATKNSIMSRIFEGSAFGSTKESLATSGITDPLSKGYVKGADGLYYSQNGFAQVGGALVSGVAWAGTAYLAVTLIGGLLGLAKGTQQALQNAVLAGGFIAGTLNGIATNGLAKTGIFSKTGLIGGHPIPIGLAVAAIVFVLTYEEEKIKTVTFSCMPWQPPTGGARCEECNKDKFRPCSEYRCRALGQACQLLNAGSNGNEKCAWVNPKDVTSPVISPSQSALTTGMKYNPLNTTRGKDTGVRIVNPADSNGCIKAFTPLAFGVQLNEPAQCKLDYTRSNMAGKLGYDALQYYFGGSNLYDYNHTQVMALPSPNTEGVNTSVLLENGNTMNLYVKCMDANGNVNEDDFLLTFCVNKGPDTTPPIVVSTSIEDGGYVGYNVNNVPIQVYTNEPAQCKWSRIDKAYADMENSMGCASNSAQINNQLTYTCSGNLTGVKNQENNKFFFRCKDYPDNAGAGNNVMQQSYSLTLKGSQPLGITYVKPNGDIKGNTDVIPTTIEVRTNQGAEDGKATCYYSDINNTNNWLPMFVTNNYISTQSLDLVGSAGGTSYTYYVKCIDAGGNAAQSYTSVNVYVDKEAPIVARAYKENPDALKLIMSENAECSYSLSSCNFSISDGIKMLHPTDNDNRILAAEWKNNAVYHIKCTDGYGNVNSDATACTLVVSAVDLSAKTL
jgi:hypothetical protein